MGRVEFWLVMVLIIMIIIVLNRAIALLGILEGERRG